jgi:hypothetical protein
MRKTKNNAALRPEGGTNVAGLIPLLIYPQSALSAGPDAPLRLTPITC